MTDQGPETCTALTLLFEGEGHEAAAKEFMIQFADGGLADQIEELLTGLGHAVTDTDFDLESGTMKIVVAT